MVFVYLLFCESVCVLICLFVVLFDCLGVSLLCFLFPRRCFNRSRIRCSALSRMAQVFRKMTSASSSSWVDAKPCSPMMDAIISLSLKFMAQP